MKIRIAWVVLKLYEDYNCCWQNTRCALYLGGLLGMPANMPRHC